MLGNILAQLQNKRLVYLLHRVSQVANQAYANASEAASLTPTQYIVLSALDEKDDVSQVDLVLRTGIDRSTLANVVRRLMREGFVARRHSTRDRRAYSVKLTAMGADVLRSCDHAAKLGEERQLAVLSQKARRDFIAMLSTLVANPPTRDELG